MSSIKAIALAKATASGGGDVTLETLNVSANATYNAPSGKAYNKVNVNVPEKTLGTKTITAVGTYAASGDNLDGYSSVTVTMTDYDGVSF